MTVIGSVPRMGLTAVEEPWRPWKIRGGREEGLVNVYHKRGTFETVIVLG